MKLLSNSELNNMSFILKIKNFNDNYEYHNISGYSMSRKLSSKNSYNLNKNIELQFKNVNELYKLYREQLNIINESSFAKIKKFKRVKTRLEKNKTIFIDKIRILSNIITTKKRQDKKKIKTFIYKFWIFCYKINIFEKILMIINNNMNDEHNIYIQISMKKYCIYFLLSLLIIYMLYLTNNNKHLISYKKIIKQLLSCSVKCIHHFFMNNIEYYFSSLLKYEKIIKTILKKIFKSSDNISILLVNKLNKINYLFNNTNLISIKNIFEFADSEIFSTNIILDNIDYNNQEDIMIPFISEKPSKDYTLVLDLDETLIHFCMKNNGEGKLFFRPYLIEFLNSVSKYYEIIIFTAGIKEYAQIVLNLIENILGKKIFKFRLFREHISFSDKGCFVKDLSKIGRDLSKILIVDNNEENFELQKENGILIHSYYGMDSDINSGNNYDGNDRCLNELENILIKIAEEKPNDVTLLLKRYYFDISKKVSLNL